jgi:hypothetical protein
MNVVALIPALTIPQLISRQGGKMGSGTRGKAKSGESQNQPNDKSLMNRITTDRTPA